MLKNNSDSKNKLIEKYEKNIEKLEKSIFNINDDINKLQIGDTKKPYWNGNNARNVLKSVSTQTKKSLDFLNLLKDLRNNIK